jgi:hypothetical protein
LELEPADAEVVKQALSWFMGDMEKYRQSLTSLATTPKAEVEAISQTLSRARAAFHILSAPQAIEPSRRLFLVRSPG